ncbi:MAG: hypothetical protein QME73_12590 [Bacillota bacterium]|nr:hypothetical protein [Bacillota bacterium]
MYLFVVTYNDEHKTADLINRYKEKDIRGATIIDTMGSGRYVDVENYLSKPVIVGIKRMLEHHFVHNRTLYMIIRTKETLRDAIKITEEVLGDLTKPGTGIMFAIPVMYVKGGSFSQPELYHDAFDLD